MIALCWFVVVLDGYDLIVYGTTLPHIMDDFHNLDGTAAGFMGSLVFVGALIGAIAAGDFSDRVGRKKTILICGLVFTVFTMAIYVAPNREVFGILRFIAGVGLGGLIPSANAITAEFVDPKHRSFVSTIMMSGIPIGGSISAVLGLVMLPEPGWRTMYLLAGVGLIVLGLVAWIMPESPSWLHAHGRHEEATRVAREWGIEHTLGDAEAPSAGAAAGKAAPKKSSIGALLSGGWATATVLFALASIFTLFTWYGLGTWLPKLMMQDSHYSTLMFNPLVFLLSLNLGAVVGSVATAWAGVRFGPMNSGIVAALLAAAGLAFLLTYPDSPSMANLALVFAGIGTHGTQCLVLAAIANHYPARLRGKALGFASGLGRIGAITAPILGGWLMDQAGGSATANAGTSWNFVMFSVAAALAAVTLLLIAVRNRAARSPASESGAHVPVTS